MYSWTNIQIDVISRRLFSFALRRQSADEPVCMCAENIIIEMLESAMVSWSGFRASKPTYHADIIIRTIPICSSQEQLIWHLVRFPPAMKRCLVFGNALPISFIVALSHLASQNVRTLKPDSIHP